MKIKKIRNVAIITVLLVAPAIWMTMSVLSEVKVECKVCMNFKGRNNCGKAIGDHKDSCIQTAKDNACALIASGMAESIQCSQAEALSIDVQ